MIPLVCSLVARRARCGLLVFTLAGAGAGSLLAADTVLVLDNFNANTPNVNDLNVDLARQTGTLAPASYNIINGPTHYGHQLQNVNAPNQLLCADFANSTSSLNVNFNGANSAGGLKISFDLDSNPLVYGNTDATFWGCINLGASMADQLVNVNGAQTHFGVLFRANGRLQAFNGSAVVSPATEPIYSTQARGTTNHVDIIITDVDGNPFDGVGSTIIEIYGNGASLPAYIYTNAAGYANNYINVQGNFRAHFDNLTVTRLDGNRTPVVVNPSFEANSFSVFPGYVSGNGAINSWASLGNHGLNPASGSPFADNGAIPDGVNVAFMQGDGVMSQVIKGFKIGSVYEVRYFENSRTGGTIPASAVRVGGVTVKPASVVSQVGGSNPYHEVLTASFNATASSMLLEFVKSNPQGGDTTLLIDNVSVRSPSTPPSLFAQPADLIGILGGNASFSSVALGSAPLRYQWYFGASSILDATNNTLLVPVDSTARAGFYSVVVTNNFGSVTSRLAELIVRQPVPGLFNTGVDGAGVALADNTIDAHYKLIVNADSASMDAIVENSAAFPIVTGPWVANNAAGKWIGPRFDTSAAAGLATGGGVYVYRITFDMTGLDYATAIITGTWAIDNEGQEIRVNGVSAGIVNNNGFASLTPFTLNSLNATFVSGMNTIDFVTRNVDTVAGYTGLRVADLVGSVTPPNTPPRVLTQPQSYTAGTGESYTFTVLATGSSPLSYQWTHAGTNLPGATSAILTLNNLTHEQAGAYVAVVTNPGGSTNSVTATLTVRDSIPGMYDTGVDASRVALADGVVDGHYRLVVNPDSTSADAIVQDSTLFPIVAGPWLANTPTSKWIGPRLDTTSAAGGLGALGNYTYRFTFELAGYQIATAELLGNWASDNAGVDILINGQSTGLSNTTEFTAYTPFRITNGFLAGENTVDFTINNASLGWTGLRVSGLRCLGTLLPPGTAPVVLQQPQPVLANYGDTATFKVRANGSTPLSYQWYFEDADIPGANSSSYSVLVDFPDVAGRYSVKVSNGAGMVTSAYGVLTINNPPVIPARGGATSQDTPFSFATSKLSQGVTDPDGDSFALQSVATTSLKGGTVATNVAQGGYTYTPPVGYTGNDSFEFVFRDSRGGVATGTMEMIVLSGAVPSSNMVVMLPLPGGGFLLRFAGIPGHAYNIQRSTDLVAWPTIATRTAPAHGIIEYTDPAPPPGQAFYRTQAAP